jgi:DNA repair protein RadC
LTEAELLALIIRTGTKENSAVKLAEEVLSLGADRTKGLIGLHRVSLEDLQSIKGIGLVKAVKLKCLTELSMRMSAEKAKEGLTFHSPSQVAAYFMEKLRHRPTECVILVCVDSKGEMIAESKLSEGSARASLISPREIFLEALDKKAVNIVLLHNHPSGDPTPSMEDRKLTKQLKELGDKLDIPLLDHVVIGDNRYVSFKEQAWFERDNPI